MSDDTNTRLTRLEATVDEVKTTLGRLEPLLIKVLEAQAEMRGEMRGQFDQMGQRISDLNARLPTAIGVYQPPGRPAA